MTHKVISHYTLQLLLTQKKAVLPSLGMLYLEPISARIDKNTGVISPPGYSVHFAPSDRINVNQLKSQLLLWEQMTEIEAERIIEKFTRGLRENLLAGGITIDKIGELRNTEEGIEFYKNPEIHDILNPLPELNLTFVEATLEDKKIAAANAHAAMGKTGSATTTAHKTTEELKKAEESSGDNIEKPRRKRKFPWLLLIFIISLLFIISMGIYFYLNNGEREALSGTDIGITHIEEEPDKIKVENEVIEKEQDMWIGDKAGSEEEFSEGTESNEPELNENGGDSGSVPSDEVADDAREAGEVENSAIVDGAENTGINKPTGDCVIIVGAFGSLKNVERMEKKLSDLGWKVYREQPIRLTKMGVYVPCEYEELQSVLREIKKTIEPGAWIFKEK